MIKSSQLAVTPIYWTSQLWELIRSIRENNNFWQILYHQANINYWERELYQLSELLLSINAGKKGKDPLLLDKVFKEH